jgi:ABC-2 type transport system ATP-binding protein
MSDDRSIQVSGLVREFKGGVRAVDGIDLHVASGEIYGFLGPNGAGKSTTVKVLTTLLPPTAGRATVAGYDVAKEGASVRAAIGVALQDVALDPMLTGREHMRLQGGLQGIPRAERATRGNELLERVGLMDAADRKSATYSGGMKRRLDLALALLHNPRILFLDEPTTGLDVQSRTAMWDEVGRLAREEGTTVFLTTQYLEEADVLADRVGIIDNGVLVAEGTPAQLKAQVSKPTVEVTPRDASSCADARAALAPFGDPVGERTSGSIAVRLRSGAEQLADIVRALDAANITVAHLAMHEPTLDDVFLAKTGRSLEGAGDAPAPGGAAAGAPEREKAAV